MAQIIWESQEMYASARQEGRGEKKLKTQTKFSQILNADKILIVPDNGLDVCSFHQILLWEWVRGEEIAKEWKMVATSCSAPLCPPLDTLAWCDTDVTLVDDLFIVFFLSDRDSIKTWYVTLWTPP